MLRMLLADDDPVFLSKLERLLTQYAAQQQRKVWIDAYPRDDLSGFVLQSMILPFWTLISGDRRGAGIDLARRLRQKRNDAIIIFVTSYVEYAPEGYELRAFRYLLKTDVDAKLEAYFSQAAEQFAAKREILPIQTGGELRNLTVDEILYLESDKHTVRIYMFSSSAGPYSCYASLQSFEEKAPAAGFPAGPEKLSCQHAPYQKASVRRGCAGKRETLPVSEKNYRQIKRAYLLWKGAQTWST